MPFPHYPTLPVFHICWLNESYCFTTCLLSPYLSCTGLPSDVNLMPTGCGCSLLGVSATALRAFCACGSSQAADDPSKHDTPCARAPINF